MEIKCNKCGGPINQFGICEACLAREDAAATAFCDNSYSFRRARSSLSWRILDKQFNKILFVLVIICVISLFSCLFTYKSKSDITESLSNMLPQNQTSGYVLGQYKAINDLQVLKINKADFYTYKDENRSASLIIRYYINAAFDLNNVKVVPNNNGTIDIELKKPIIEPHILEGSKYTKDKLPEDYAGVEIFCITNDFFQLGYDFKIGEIEDIAKFYVNNELKKNVSEYEEMAFSNLKEKLIPMTEKLGLKITNFRLEGEAKYYEKN